MIELQKANRAYEQKLLQDGATEETMFSLSWDTEELKPLTVKGIEFMKIWYSV